MTQTVSIKILRIVLVLTGLTFTFGIWPLGIVWPSGWVWHEAGRSEYLEMILGIYATLGVFLMLAARDPMAHRSRSGSRSGRASCTAGLWVFRLSPIPGTSGISGGMLRPCLPLRRSWPC